MRQLILAAGSNPMLLKGLRDGIALGLGIAFGAGLFALVILAAG